MPSLGHLIPTPRGFEGELRTLSLRVKLAIVANDAPGTAPDYRVFAGDFEIGAGWNRRNPASGADYVSLALAAPEFGPRRLYADLRPEDGGFALVWVPAD